MSIFIDGDGHTTSLSGPTTSASAAAAVAPLGSALGSSAVAEVAAIAVAECSSHG